MKRVQVINHKLPYGNVYHDIGAVLTMPDEHAKVLRLVKRVRVIEDEAVQPRRRRVYRRKDAKPAETVVMEPEVA